MANIAKAAKVSQFEPGPMPDEEYWKIMKGLQCYPHLFQVLIRMGVAVFSRKGKTASVGWNSQLKKVVFRVNPEYWEFTMVKDCDKLFLFCHEACHVLLDHLFREEDLFKKYPKLVNQAQDIVINEETVRSFAVVREDLSVGETYCWITTCFSEQFRAENEVLPNQTYLYYFNLLLKQQEEGKQPEKKPESPDEHGGEPQQGAGNGQPEQEPPQDGDGAGDQPDPKAEKPEDGGEEGTGPGQGDESEDAEPEEGAGGAGFKPVQDLTPEEQADMAKAVAGQLNDKLTDEEKEELKGMLAGIGGEKAGTGLGNMLQSMLVPRAVKKPKWEQVVTRVTASLKRQLDAEKDTWVGRSRRFTLLPERLPNPKHVPKYQNERYHVVFFIDTSGSCWDLAARLFKMLGTVPKEHFEIKVCCFDTRVYPIDWQRNPQAVGGGGTNFGILERWLQETGAAGGFGSHSKYPDAVFVLTDGLGTPVTPQEPHRWYWLLKDRGQSARKYVHEKSKHYLLSEFE